MAVITISRQFGSHGDTVAQLLCERLNYRLFDKNLMAGLGAQFGLKPGQIGDVSVDTHSAKSLIERLFGNYQAPWGDVSGWTFGATQDAREETAVAQARDLILAAYEQGDVVIVGRGGQVVLAGKPAALHVRLVAPLDVRVARHGQRAGLDLEDAQAVVLKRDAASADFVKRFFDADIADPALYDVVINTARITPAAATDLIIRLLAALPVPA